MKYASTLLLSFCFSMVAIADSSYGIMMEWQGFSDPEILSSGFTHKLTDLPLEGMIDTGTKNWSSHYWPTQKGGINSRWNTKDQEGFKYKSPDRAVVVRMSQEQLMTLAPSEKFDLFMGKYDYPLRKEVDKSTSPRADDWSGICHGWSPAALHHNEPSPKTVTNPDGIVIPFGSADIKALLSYYYAKYYETDEGHQVGLRCFFGSWLGGTRACSEDLNAGAFHIIIANKLGLEKEGFVGDVDRFKEVWNQPIVGFKSVVVDAFLPVSPGAAKKAVKEMRIKTELFYVDESDPKWEVVHGTKDQIIAKKDLAYRIEVSAEGKIVGGAWESEERPDFLWTKPKAPSFEGKFSRLSELLND